jgi:hypothetical protein
MHLPFCDDVFSTFQKCASIHTLGAYCAHVALLTSEILWLGPQSEVQGTFLKVDLLVCNY